MRTVATLEECDKTKVYRCVEVTMAWVERQLLVSENGVRVVFEGAWCRLDTYPGVTWTPITFEPTPFPGVGPDGRPWVTDGPCGFIELGSIDELDYSDYRNQCVAV